MVNYRRFEVEAEHESETLESLCREALSSTNDKGVSLWERAEDRLLDLGEPGGKQLILNKVADLSSAVFGEMCLIQSRGLQALLERRVSKVKLSDLTTAEIFNLDERFAPNGSQFIRGMGYWLAIGNHLFFIKTQSLLANHMADYIKWLLEQSASIAAKKYLFNLRAEFDRTQLIGDLGDIKKLRVSGISTPHIAVDISAQLEEKTVATSRKVTDKTFLFERAREVTEALMGKSHTDSLVESLGPEEYLAVDASVKVKGRRTETSKAKLREIANDLSDLTDAKVQIEGKDGSISDDDAILRTRMPFEVAHDGSNLLEFDNVADQLQEVYSRFVRDGKLEA
jgi:hypothetical protein